MVGEVSVMMKLYECHNGFMGYAPVRVLVVASSEEEARELARDAFRNEGESEIHGSRYWSDIEVELLCDDLDASWVGEVNDG